MNLAKGLEPYRHNAVFTQSPLSAQESAYKNAKTSALLHRETAVTAFQYPFAINLNDCKPKPDWARSLLKAIGELSNVAGNHARSYYEMAPASIVGRLTETLVAGYETYGFKPDPKHSGQYFFPEVINGLLHEPCDFPNPSEFFIGGKIVKEMPEEVVAKLQKLEVTLDRDPRRLLDTIANRAFGG